MSPGEAEDPAQVIPESLADLLERPLYAHMATVRPDGTPQVNPTWYRFDGEYVWLTATTYRQKYRNWRHQPATALSIADPDDPSRYLEVRGVVERIIPRSRGSGVRPPGRALWRAPGATGRQGVPHRRGDPAEAHHHPMTRPACLRLM